MSRVTKYYYIAIFVAVSLAVYYIFESMYQNRKNDYISMKQKLALQTYNSVIKSFKIYSDIVFLNSINNDEILDIYDEVLDANNSRRAELRQKLYSTLLPLYKNMHSFQTEQLQFHLPNNESFLRFYKPDRFGDNLTEFRETVAYVNKYKKPVDGFEEGRVFNGYRFVYPLFKNKKYLGSVEISVSIKVIISSFQKEFNSKVDFIIRKSIVKKKIFSSEQANYRDTLFNKKFMYEKGIKANREIEKLILSSGLANEINQKIETNNLFFINIASDNFCTFLLFLPIKNGVTNNNVGYLIIKMENSILYHIHLKFILLTLFFILFTGVVLIFQYRIQRNQAELTYQKKILEEVQQIGNLGYWEINFLDNKKSWSHGLFNIIGEKRNNNHKMSFEKFLDFVHSEDRDMVEAKYLNSIKEKSNYKIYHRIVSVNGKIRYIEHQCKHIIDDTGNIIQSIGSIHDITTLKTGEIKLKRAKDQYEALVSHIPDIIFRAKIDSKLTMIYMNVSIERISGYKASDFIFNHVRSFRSIIHKDDIEMVNSVIKDAVANSNQYTVEYRIYNSDNKIIWLNERGRITRQGHQTIIEGVINDITPQKMAYEKLQKFIDTQEAIVFLSTGRNIIFANRQFLDFLGFKDLDDFKSKHKCICERFLRKDNVFHLELIPEDSVWIDELLKRDTKDRVVSMYNKLGKEYIFAVSVNSFDDGNYIISFNDITDRFNENMQLQNDLIRDPLTEAFNRKFFDLKYKSIVQTFKKRDKRVGVIIFDIDHFKRINDTYGHNIGDVVLKELVQRVKSRIRKDVDHLIRWGGEEFLLLVPINDRDGLLQLAEHIRKYIASKNFESVGQVTCSLGATIYEEEEDIIQTIERADSGLYEAKQSGRNRVVVK